MDGASRDSNPHSTLEEEAKKRTTDCVYFLASPLTCIKGADCEFRHSEVARVNPRDCWFWRNGNCLNPKCAFRHPPLDGFRENSAAPSSSVSRPALPSAAPLTHFPSYKPGLYQPRAHSSNRQKIPCYYFQKGTCLKGDKCPFMHGSEPGGDSTSLQAAETIPASVKETMNDTENLILQQENPYRYTMQPVGIPPIVQAYSKAGHASTSASEKKMLINGGDKTKRHLQDTMLVCGGNTISTHQTHQSQVHDAQVQSGKDVDECLGESSPGFDVLVDDDVEEAEYFDANIEGGLSHGRKHLRSMREFDYIASSMDPLGEFEVFESDPPDAYRQNHDLYGWERSHSSMERDLEIPSSEERKLRFGENGRDVTNGQDLRHHLSKRRRANVSAISAGSDHHRDLWRRDDKLDRYHRHSHQERAQHFNVESSISKRLKGRIKFPDNHSQVASSERDLDMETKRRQMCRVSSPSRSAMHREKHSNKARERPKDSVSSEGKVFGGQIHRKSEERKESLNFAGPKSLAELRNAKISETRIQSSASFNRQVLKRQVIDGEDEKNVGPRKSSSQNSSAQLSFEGPKRLGVILKRKQEMASADSCGSRNADENSQIEGSDEESEPMNMQNPMVQPSEILEESNNGVHSPNNIENIKGKLDSIGEVYSVLNDELHPQMDRNAQVEDGSMLGMHGQRAGNLDVNGECDDVGSEGRNCTDENLDGEDEYLEDEDGDDFARKLGVMFS